MINRHIWRAGFELEVILGDLGDPRFEEEMEWGEPMDCASPAFCRTVAKRLKEATGQPWTAPSKATGKPGFYVIAEYGLDPLLWPEGRLAGVELLTPPLPLPEADAVRSQIATAIFDIDGDFNFIPSKTTADCGWHINIDAGDEQPLDPHDFICGTDELLLLARNERLFSQYTGLQRHAVGIPLLRHMQQDPTCSGLTGSGLPNLLNATAGRSKSYAANFAKLERGYIELRHFSAISFFTGPSLVEQLDRIPAAMERTFSQGNELQVVFLGKLKVLFEWLDSIRDRFAWKIARSGIITEGDVLFDGEPIATFLMNGSIELNLLGPKRYQYIATMRDVLMPDIAEAVALLALDIAELDCLGFPCAQSPSKKFRQAISQLGARLDANPTFSSDYQLSVIKQAEEERRVQRF